MTKNINEMKAFIMNIYDEYRSYVIEELMIVSQYKKIMTLHITMC